jgi:subtilase family serine protease
MTAPSTAGPGSTISVNETTKNQGGSSAAASTTRYYLSANYMLDAGDEPLQSRPVGPLAANATHFGVTNVTIPLDTGTGTFYLIAKADDVDVVDESSDTNNTKWVQLRVGADLQVFSMSAPSRGIAGTTINVIDTTKNIGGGPAGASTTAFYLSTNVTFDAGDLPLTARSIPDLDPNQTSSATTPVPLPAVGPGTWYLMARADDSDAVAETLEINNVRYVTVYIGPDLTISAMSVPSTIVAGSTVNVSHTVKNLGAETAPPSTTRFYLSLNPTLDTGDTLLDAYRDVPALVMNATSAGTTGVLIPDGFSGSYYLLAVADGNVTIAESSETNNVTARLVTIQ